MNSLIEKVEYCSRPIFKITRESLGDKYWKYIVEGKLIYSKEHYDKIKYYSKWFALVFKLFSVYKQKKRICMPSSKLKLPKQKVLRWFSHNQHLFLSNTNYSYLLRYFVKLQNKNKLEKPFNVVNRNDYKYAMLIYDFTCVDMPGECFNIILSYFGDGFSGLNMYIGGLKACSLVHNGCNADYYDYFIEYILKVNYFNINV